MHRLDILLDLLVEGRLQSFDRIPKGLLVFHFVVSNINTHVKIVFQLGLHGWLDLMTHGHY
jgi:hypothetical protein